MEKLPEDPKETKYAFFDYCQLIFKSKKTIALCMVIGALACSCYALTRHVYFLTSSSFRDKGKPQTSFGSSLTDFIFSNGTMVGDSETISTLKSRKLLSRVIDQLGLQATVAPLTTYFQREFQDFKDNILAEYAYWLKIKTPILNEINTPFKVRDVVYTSEIPSAIVLEFSDNSHFIILGDAEKTVYSVGETINKADYSFTLHWKNDEETPFKEKTFTVTFFPLDLTTQIYNNLLVIEVDREDKSLLRLNFKHRDRHFGSEYLNTLVSAYQQYLKEDHDFISNFHLDYLKDRQIELGKSLQTLMEKHASRISEDLSANGFLDSEKEMEFLAGNSHNLQQKISEIDFEKKRLEKLNDLDFVYYDQYGGRGDSVVINQLLGEIRGLKQQIDVLNLSLEKQEKRDDNSAKKLLDEQFAELNNIRSELREIDELFAAISSDDELTARRAMVKPTQHLTPQWLKSFIQKDDDNQLCYKDHFCAYLQNLKDMLRLKEATINERLKHNHHYHQEFQGITLETARNLFYHYTTEINTIQSQIKQHQFVIEELKQPDFEVCSLTAILHDPVSAERIGKASYLLIQLRDENNRTQKEMARIKDELETLKKFLSAHLEQMVELFALRENLLQEKIYALQSLTLDLSYQQIYVLKKNLTDYLATRLENLSYEKALIKEHQDELNTRMAKIPSRWAAEKTILQHLATHQKFLENLSGMVESKNISKNLELIQSTPVDQALPAVNPKPPRAVLFAILGSILGLISSVGFLVARSLVIGVPVSAENLKLANFYVAGDFSLNHEAGGLLRDRDLNTLRRLVGFFERTLTNSRKVLFIEENSQDAAADFASLLAKKGEKVVLLDLSFNSVPLNDTPGLLQLLENNAAPKINKKYGLDFISSGGVTRYGPELLLNKRFKDFLQELLAEYSWVVGYVNASINNAESINLSSLFDGVAVLLKEETIEEMKAFEEQLDHEKVKAVGTILLK